MGYTLLHNGTLIDGRGGEPIRDGAVLLHDKKIQAVGRKADIPLPDSEITMIDAGGVICGSTPSGKTPLMIASRS